MRGLGAQLVGLAAKVQGLHLAGFNVQNQLEAAFRVGLLLQAHMAAGEKQVAVLHCLVDLGQVFLEIGRGGLIRVEAVEGFGQLHQAVKVVVKLEELAPLLVLALSLLELVVEGGAAWERAKVVSIPSNKLVVAFIFFSVALLNRVALIIESGDRLG